MDDIEPDTSDTHPDTSEATSQQPASSSPRRTTVEDVPDEDDLTDQADHRYILACPEELRAGEPVGHGITEFDEEEWQLAEWLLKNVGQMQAEAFLKLPIVRFFFLLHL